MEKQHLENGYLEVDDVDLGKSIALACRTLGIDAEVEVAAHVKVERPDWLKGSDPDAGDWEAFMRLLHRIAWPLDDVLGTTA
jgi:hypothetical protein